jgi:drug/metabolite transporter (DMT)-like permease
VSQPVARAEGDGSGGHPARLPVLLAFAAIYVIWGATYLAIRFAIETVPPLLMAAVRFLIAGGALYAWLRWRGAARPAATHWRAAAMVGAFMLLGGNGAVVWAEQRVPSGVTALLVAMVPLWMVLIDWARPGGVRPTLLVAAGLALGLAGLALLIGPEQLLGGARTDHAGALVLALGCLSWSLGSVYSRHAPLPSSPQLATAMEMLAGGALLLVASLARGEWPLLDPHAVSLRSLAALGFLVVFGSLVAFSAYIWLLRQTTPARVSTYAYVNPVVAMLLGWAFAGEPLSARTLLAAAVIVAGVVLITSSKVKHAGA